MSEFVCGEGEGGRHLVYKGEGGRHLVYAISN